MRGGGGGGCSNRSDRAEGGECRKGEQEALIKNWKLENRRGRTEVGVPAGCALRCERIKEGLRKKPTKGTDRYVNK